MENFEGLLQICSKQIDILTAQYVLQLIKPRQYIKAIDKYAEIIRAILTARKTGVMVISVDVADLLHCLEQRPQYIPIDEEED